MAYGGGTERAHGDPLLVEPSKRAWELTDEV